MLTPRQAIEQRITNCNNNLRNLERRSLDLRLEEADIKGQKNGLQDALEELDKAVSK